MHNLHKIKIQLENLRHPNENAEEEAKGRKSIKLNLAKLHAQKFLIVIVG